jgi:hypothetical protein
MHWDPTSSIFNPRSKAGGTRGIDSAALRPCGVRCAGEVKIREREFGSQTLLPAARGSPPSLKRHDPSPASRTGVVAEREGFEPSVTFLLRSLSKGVLSTTQPSFR